jgi:glutamate carboxypeptidase
LISGGTAVNTVPQHCRFVVDLRVETASDGETYTSAILGLKPHDPDVRISVAGGMNRPPFERTDGTARLFEHARALAAELGFDLQDVPKVGGGSDGNFTAALGVPTLDGLGIDGAGAHTLQEYGLVSSILPRLRLMERLLETLV